MDDAIGWFGARSLAHEAALRAQAERDPGALARALSATARGALREVWDATVEGRSADPAAVGLVNDAAPPRRAARAPPDAGGHRASAIGTRPRTRSARRSPGWRRPLAEALAEGDTTRFRICANDACRWVFEDTSRGGRRRWCDMQSCGNRAKVRRFRSRQRAEDAGGAVAAPRRTATTAAPGESAEA